MSRPVELPHEAQVLTAAKELLQQADETGAAPSVLALARRFGLSNTTFRRHYPDVAQQIGDARRTPTPANAVRAGTSRYDALVAREAKLHRANASLTDNLKLAAAHIHRLSLENHRLRRELEDATKVTNTDSKTGLNPRRGR